MTDKQLTEKEINSMLLSAKKSMEIEGFEIDSELVEQGRKVLMGEIKAKDLILEFIIKAKEDAKKSKD